MQVTPAVAVRAGAPMTVRVDYTGVPSAIPSRRCGASPWLRTADGAVAVGEPDIAPWWYPCNDHPTDKASFTITAVVPTDLQAISNGALLGGPEAVEPGWQRWRWQQSEPMATYRRRCVGGSNLLGQAGRMRRREVRTPLPSSSFAGFRFPPEMITVAVRWYLR